MNVGVILAGGTGARVGAGIPKQFINVQGKPILAYTLEIFQKNGNIDAFVVNMVFPKKDGFVREEQHSKSPL